MAQARVVVDKPEPCGRKYAYRNLVISVGKSWRVNMRHGRYGGFVDVGYDKRGRVILGLRRLLATGGK